MSEFLTELEATLLDDDKIWQLEKDLVYESDLLKCKITVPAGFQTDFASVPRWVPIASNALLDKAHREGTLHDYLYSIDSVPVVTESQANDVFLEAMTVRGKSWAVRYPMYWAVCAFGWTAFHKDYVSKKLYGRSLT